MRSAGHQLRGADDSDERRRQARARRRRPGDGREDHDATDLTVFPPASVCALDRRWAVYDPPDRGGATTAELARLGFSAPAVGLGDDLSEVDVLVVGTKVLDGTLQLPATAADVDRGLRILLFEQSAGALQAMGLRTEDVVPRFVFPRVADHPALAGLTPANLVNWRGSGRLVPETKANGWPYPDKRMHWGNRGSVASVVIETPHQGAFTPIVECAFDLSFSPLLEWRHGEGCVLFCQMDVTDRTATDPAADRLVVNLLGHLDHAPVASAAARVVFIGSDAADRVLLDDVGMELRVADPAELDLQPAEIVVLGRAAVTDLSPVARDAITAHVRQGGTVVLLPRRAEELRSRRVAVAPPHRSSAAGSCLSPGRPPGAHRHRSAAPALADVPRGRPHRRRRSAHRWRTAPRRAGGPRPGG